MNITKNYNTSKQQQRTGGLPSFFLLLKVILLSVFMLQSSLFSKEVLYKKKPVWWDSINVKIIAGKNYNNTYSKTFAPHNFSGVKIENWSVLGPFNNNNDKPFKKTYGPDKDLTFNKKAVFTGLKGKQIIWTPWRKGTKCPIDQKLEKCVIFLYSIYKAPKAGKYYIVFTSDDGAAVWINKKKVFLSEKPGGMNFVDPDLIEVNLMKGKNEILVKLENKTDIWNLFTLFTQVDPKPTKVKTLIELYNKAPKASSQDRKYLQRYIKKEFLKLHDYSNFIYWFNNALKDEDKNKKSMLELTYIVTQHKAFLPYVIDYFRNAFGNPKLTKDTRKFCANYVIRTSLKNDDYKSLQSFLKIHSSSLKTLMPYDYLALKIKLHIRKGEFEDATKLAEELQKKCEGKNKQKMKNKFKYLFAIVKTIKSSAVQLPIDYDYTAIKNQTGKYMLNRKLPVNRFIRQILTSKSRQVISTQEKTLFIGALPKYKKLFAPFLKKYSKDLNTYLSLLKKTETIDPTTYLQRKALLSLDKINVPANKQTENLSTLNLIKMPSKNEKPFPFLEMHQGNCEMQAEENLVNNTLQKQVPAFITSFGKFKIFQNYHTIICIENNKIKWEFSIQDSVPKTYKVDNIRTFLIFGKTNPLINNGKVYARLMKNGIITLFCFDISTGTLNWSFNQKDTEICSGIATWRDSLIFLGKEHDAIPRYYLYQINKNNGKIANKTFLFSSDSSFLLKSSKQMQVDLFTPTPLIIDNQSFITTNSGVVFAFDLLNNSFMWIKKYNKGSYNDDKSIATLSGRQSSTPIVWKDNILFMPYNSAYFMLLNKNTGEKIKRVTIDWQEVIPCGNQVIIIDVKRKASFYSLKDLKQGDFLPGENYRFIQRLSDGVVLQNKNKLLIYDFNGKLKKSLPMPKETLAVYIDNNSLFTYNAKNNAPAILEKFLPNQPSTVLNPNTDKTLPEMVKAKLKKIGNDTYIVSASALIRVNPDTSIKWIRPLPSLDMKKRFYSAGKLLYFFIDNRIFCIDKNNGSILNSFPEYGQKLLSIEAEIVTQKETAFLNGRSWAGKIVQFTTKKQQVMGSYRGDTPIAAFESGTLIAAWERLSTKIRFLRKDPQKGSYSTATKSYKLKKPFRPYTRKVINKQTVMLYDYENLLLVNADKTVNEIKLIKGKSKISAWNRKGKSFGIEGDYCIIWNYFDIANIIDMKNKKDIGNIPKFTSFPIFVNGQFIGFSKDEIICFDPASKKIVYRFKDWIKTKDKRKKDEAKKHMISFKYGKKAAFYFPPPNSSYRKQSQIGRFLLMSPGKLEFDSFHFPAGNRGTTYLSTGEGLLINLPSEEKVIRIPQKMLNTLKGKSPNFYTSNNTPIEYTIDGYSDEWDLSKFHKINKNRFDARIPDKKYVILAIELNDRKWINILGKNGFDERFKIMICPGSVVSLTTNNIMQPNNYKTSFYDALKTSKEKKIKISYSVKPDGSSCFIEIKVPINKIISIPLKYHLKNEIRNQRGDIAFDIIYTDNFGKKHALLSNNEIPAFFPSILFPDLNKKK